MVASRFTRPPSAQLQEALERWKLEPGQIVELDGKVYLTAQGILVYAQRSEMLNGVEMHMVQVEDKELGKPCIMKATVRLKDGRVFEEYADSEGTKIPAVRMASTRARTRALKLAFPLPLEVAEE